MDIFIKIWDTIVDFIENIIRWAINLLPNSPFTTISNSVVADYLPYLNWILPINEVLAIMQAWLTAISIFYIYQAYLRWVKAIE